MKTSKGNGKRLFLLGLVFVITSYALIQCINNISAISSIIAEGITITKPFLVAFVLSYILYPIVKLIENKLKVKRFYSVLLTYTILFSFISIGVNFIFPMIISSLSDLLKDLPQYLNQIQATLADLLNKLNINSDLDLVSTINKAIIDILPNINNILTQSVSSAVDTTISVFNSIFNIFVTIVASFYILLERESFINTSNLILKKFLKEKTYFSLVGVIQALHLNIGKYLLGKGTNSMILAFTAFIGLSIAKANYAGLLSILFGIMNMIPLIGPIISTIIAVALNIFTSLPKSLFILIFLFAIQQIESFILEPKTIGKSLNLSGFSTLFSISVFGQLFGIAGMILGIPIMSLIKTYGSKLLELDEEKQNTIK